MRIGRWTFDPMIPTVVVVIAIAVIFSVGKVVLSVVTNKISQRKAVMGGDEIHRLTESNRFLVVEVRTALEALSQRPRAVFVAFPEPTEAIAKVTVPCADSTGWKIFQPVEPAAVPWFTDHFQVAEDRISVDRFE